MFEDRPDGIYYQTGTGEDDWTLVTKTIAMDAGDNVLEETPAAQHAELEARWSRMIRQGAADVVGI